MNSPGPQRVRRLSAGLVLVAACSGGDGETAPTLDPSMDEGWIGELVRAPERFAELTEGPARAGWVALHGGDLRGAAEAFPDGVGRARAYWALAEVEADLARLSHRVWEQTFRTWAERGELPTGSAIPVVAALNALDAEDPDGARAWLARGGSYASPSLSAVATALQGGLVPLGDPALAQTDPARCINAELEARRTLDRDALGDCASRPLVSEGSPDAPRRLYDPLLFSTLHLLDQAAGTAAVGGRSMGEALSRGRVLESLLFSAWWSEAELRADLALQRLDPAFSVGKRSPDWLMQPAVGPVLPSPDAARDRVALLDRKLDAWLDEQHAQADDAGRELLDNLELGPVWRSQILTGWARAALAADRPTEALVYAQSALDLRSPRAVGPRNPPGLFVVLADANLRTGHAREALDALLPLREVWPETLGLTETLGDLVVLQGLGRPGDSKEN